VLGDATLLSLASEYGLSVAQLVLRWHLQRGIAVIPKSNSTARITENSMVFGFELSEDHMSLISGLNKNYRTGVDPNDRN
jgi:diketogulonate reductase-like aldo/keto reductase